MNSRLLTAILFSWFLCNQVLTAQIQVTQPERKAAAGWPQIFDDRSILHLNLSMTPADWDMVQNDTSYTIEVPAWFWMGNEAPILVSVRHKSSDALTSAPGFQKVSLKIDINEYVAGQRWHDLKKLSLENGDDEDVVKEGLAWGIHRLAQAPEGYAYEAALANWATLTINDVYTGVYVNPEVRDKSMLINRGLWTDFQTWLYKLSDIYSDELKSGNGESLQHLTLCYDPFQNPSGGCITPGNAALEAEMESLIDMQGMLTLFAVNAFLSHPDALLSKGKNIYFVDFLAGQKRMYLPWDLDSVLNHLNHDIFQPGEHYADNILGVPAFRTRYKQLFTDLLDGPLEEAEIHAFLDRVEPILTPWLELDPNNQIGTGSAIPDHFQDLKDWVDQRTLNVRSQILND
ncbi:MAG: CotH kinase family protein [Planctomycetota bacterium]|jgi:hypothetical protein